MDSIFWQLPGPAAFLGRLQTDLREGCNVVLLLPKSVPFGIRRALASFVRETDVWRWRTIDLTELCVVSDPVELLRTFLPSDPPIYSARTLIPALAETVVWVEGMTSEYWPHWRSFLIEYARLSRNSGWNRGVFCVAVTGEVTREAVLAEAALVTRRWRGVVDRVDMSLFVSQLLRSKRIGPLDRRLRVGLCTEIAGTDPELAVRLADLDLAALLEPHNLLRSVGLERGWMDAKEPTWEIGALDELESELVPHSAFLALHNERSEILRRIWRAQVAVVFPFIEEQRTRLIPRMAPLISVPFTSRFGEVRSLYDLEVSHLHHFARRFKMDNDTLRLLEILKRMRDRLAHLQPVAVSDLLEVQGILEEGRERLVFSAN